MDTNTCTTQHPNAPSTSTIKLSQEHTARRCDEHMHPTTQAHTYKRNTTGMMHNVKASTGIAMTARLVVCHIIY
eukprot:scaffold215978_cov51-Attheya_sp.AAC.1